MVFNDGVCGSLKKPQNYGRGKYQSDFISVLIYLDDGRQPTDNEIEDIRRDHTEKNRLTWESTIPFGGNSADIYGFNLALSVGSTSEIHFSSQRQEVLERLYSIFPNDKIYQVA